MDNASTSPNATLASDERASKHLQNLVDEADALLKATAKAGDEKFDATRERLRSEVTRLRERLHDFESRAAATVKNAAHRTDETVHAHPYAAIGAAAVAGLLLGFLLSRR